MSLSKPPTIPKELLDFDKIFINHRSKDSEVAARFRSAFPDDKIEYVDEAPFGGENKKGFLGKRAFDKSKKNILITPFEGQFFKRCPGTHQKMACCNYFVLNLGLQCNMNCSYCYLQSFINTPVMTVYSNIEKALEELDQMTSEFNGLTFRVGTGEVIDSLSLDPLTLYSRELIRFFKSRPHLTLEFKSKSDYIDQFINEDHGRNVIVSWSINPETIVTYEEHGTASLAKRLVAARKCLDKNFKTSFHIDPVIWHPSWKESYGSLVDEITTKFLPTEVPYISLGALRIQPEQKWIMKERFALDSFVNQAELFEGEDKKLRYDQDLRNEMFKFIIDRFKANNSQWNIFLCMESPETWLSTYENTPRKVDGLAELFEPRKHI